MTYFAQAVVRLPGQFRPDFSALPAEERSDAPAMNAVSIALKMIGLATVGFAGKALVQSVTDEKYLRTIPLAVVIIIGHDLAASGEHTRVWNCTEPKDQIALNYKRLGEAGADADLPTDPAARKEEVDGIEAETWAASLVTMRLYLAYVGARSSH